MGKWILPQRKGKSIIFTRRGVHHKGAVKLRKLDFVERNGYIKGVVKEIVHDPGRGAPLARVSFKDTHHSGKKEEIIVAPEGLYAGQYIYAGLKARLTIGNILPIGEMPEGTSICNTETQVGDRGVVARSSGCSAVVISHNAETGKSRIRLPSGQKKTVHSKCRAMIGMVAGGGRTEKPILKASVQYWKFKAKGKRIWPTVRGVTKNPVEHPHGGGNHQHIGTPSTVSRYAVHGRKVGLIAARRTGRKRGGKAKGGKLEE